MRDAVRVEVDLAYRRFAPVMHRRARRLLGSDAEAEDAVQDVFIKLHRAWPSFRGESEVLTWVYRITTNHCLNRLRSRDAERRALAAEALQRDARAPAPDGTELRDLLAAILQRHSVEDVAILFHRHADEMTQVEIALVVGLSERTVRDRLKRLEAEARDALATLARTWEGP